MTRIIPWILIAATAVVGCTAGPPARLTLEGASPRYTVLKSFVLPHVLEKEGMITSRDLVDDGYAYTAKIVTDRDTGRSKGFGVRLADFAIDAESRALQGPVDRKGPDKETMLQPIRLTVKASADDLKTLSGLRNETGDCDDLADSPDLVKQPHLLITLTRTDGTRKTAETITLRFFGLCPSGQKARVASDGLIYDVLDFAGMAISEQGIPARKKGK